MLPIVNQAADMEFGVRLAALLIAERCPATISGDRRALDRAPAVVVVDREDLGAWFDRRHLGVGDGLLLRHRPPGENRQHEEQQQGERQTETTG